MLLDIHTHRLPAVPGEGIFNVPIPAGECEGGVSLLSAEGCFSVGIHPWKVADAGREAWEQLEKAVKHPSVLAIGEAGLDKRCPVAMDVQEEAFIRQIRLSESVGKPLVIHCVKAFNELIRLKRSCRPQMPWVVHGFRNNRHIADSLLREGIRLSLGEKYAGDVLQMIPPERLLAETDESIHSIRELIARMAIAKNMDTERLCEQISENACRLFFRP